jgi:chaperonin GroES
MQVRLIDDRILVQPIAADDKIGSIVLPATAQERACRGRVLEVGPGKVYDSGVRVEMTTKPGNTVIFEKFAGTEVKFRGEKYLVLREHEILMIEE